MCSRTQILWVEARPARWKWLSGIAAAIQWLCGTTWRVHVTSRVELDGRRAQPDLTFALGEGEQICRWQRVETWSVEGAPAERLNEVLLASVRHWRAGLHGARVCCN